MATNIVIEDLTNGTLNANNEWSGTGVFDKLIEAVNKNIEGQYNLNRIKGTEYATVYLGAMQSVIAQSMQYLLQEKQIEAQIDKILSDKAIAEAQSAKDLLLKDEQIRATDAEADAKEYEVTYIMPAQKAVLELQDDEIQAKIGLMNQQKLSEVEETSNKAKQGLLVDSQKAMVDLQAAEIVPNGVKQRAVQDAQIAQLNAEVSYTASKEEVMEQSRIDNLALEALKAQQQNLATVGAGGLTPSTNDFAAANYMRQAVYDRARGQAFPEITFVAGGSYVKAT